MKDKNPKYLYHIYKFTQQGIQHTKYIAEGPGTHSKSHEVLEPIITDLDRLAELALREHLYYLKSQGYNQI